MKINMSFCKDCGRATYDEKEGRHVCERPSPLPDEFWDETKKLTNLNDRVRKLEKFMHENSLNIDYINSILERLTKLEEQVSQEEHVKELQERLRKLVKEELT